MDGEDLVRVGGDGREDQAAESLALAVGMRKGRDWGQVQDGREGGDQAGEDGHAFERLGR